MNDEALGQAGPSLDPSLGPRLGPSPSPRTCVGRVSGPRGPAQYHAHKGLSGNPLTNRHNVQILKTAWAGKLSPHPPLNYIIRPAARPTYFAISCLACSGLDFFICCRPDQCVLGCGPGYGKMCEAGCGLNDIVVGRVQAQLSSPCSFKMCTLLVPVSWGLPDSRLYGMCMAVHMHVFIHT